MKPGQWGWSFDELVSSWQLAEEAGFDGLSCFDHVSTNRDPVWDPVTLLGVMAAVTDRIALAVHVLNVNLRNPFLLAGQLGVVQAASGGRLRVGLGAGSGIAVEDHEATGIPFPPFEQRLERLETCCRVLPALWRGEPVTDDKLGLNNASLGDLEITAPELVLGGESDRVLDIAAKHADAWNGQGGSVDDWSEASGKLHAACREMGREHTITTEAQVFVDEYLTNDDLGDLRVHLDKLESAGADRAVLVLHHVKSPTAVERLASVAL